MLMTVMTTGVVLLKITRANVVHIIYLYTCASFLTVYIPAMIIISLLEIQLVSLPTLIWITSV